MTNPLPKRRARVLASKQLSPGAFEIRLERGDLVFRAGQEITLHGPDPTFDRTYSIASGERDGDLRVLFRLIPDGRLTPLLARLKPGDTVDYTGAFGNFVLRDPARPITFIATGTGIAPCLGFALTHPQLNLTILHGVRTRNDLFYRDQLATNAYHPCISKEAGIGFYGRVTGLLPTLKLDPSAHYYLCGANAMIQDVHGMLKKQGVPDDAIFAEPYYFW
jgi:ferredoxin-NADP reductase